MAAARGEAVEMAKACTRWERLTQRDMLDLPAPLVATMTTARAVFVAVQAWDAGDRSARWRNEHREACEVVEWALAVVDAGS